MSVCLCSFRALSRSYTEKIKTLAPFLYQTATIQQRSPTARRNASSRPPFRDDVPFEGDTLPHTIDDTNASRHTTITGSERAAFEKLHKTFNGPSRPSKGLSEHELDQIADEYYEDDDDNDGSSTSIDALFDAVLTTDTSAKNQQARRAKRVPDLATLAEGILNPESAKNKGTSRTAKIRKLQEKERARVKSLLETAKTDKELWDVLEVEVFGMMRSMELDKEDKGSNPSKQSRRRKAKGKPGQEKATNQDLLPSDPSILFANVPIHLITAARILRVNFPASSLPFNIIPTLKSLGRSSYALGATTPLYKILIRAAWIQHHSYSQICALLQDMDNGGIEYDSGIVGILDAILNENKFMKTGRLGQGLQAILALGLIEEGARQLRVWRDVVKKRLGTWSEINVQQRNLVRKQGNNHSKLHYKGPKDTLQIREPSSKWTQVGNPDDDVPLVEGSSENSHEVADFIPKMQSPR